MVLTVVITSTWSPHCVVLFGTGLHYHLGGSSSLEDKRAAHCQC